MQHSSFRPGSALHHTLKNASNNVSPGVKHPHRKDISAHPALSDPPTLPARSAEHCQVLVHLGAELAGNSAFGRDLA